VISAGFERFVPRSSYVAKHAVGEGKECPAFAHAPDGGAPGPPALQHSIDETYGRASADLTGAMDAFGGSMA
jgi:hypothetical protein